MTNTVIVCLGQALQPDGSAHPLLLARCRLAVDLHNEMGHKIINTGGSTGNTGVTEAGVMKEYMVKKLGVEEKCVIEEGRARTTVENALFVLKIMNDLGEERRSLEQKVIGQEESEKVMKMILVTSKFHMPRASYVFKGVFDMYKSEIVIEEQDTEDIMENKEKFLKVEKNIIEVHMKRTHMGTRNNYNIPLPDKEVLEEALRKVNKMLSDIK